MAKHLFKKGDPNTRHGGRKKGVPNRLTGELSQFIRNVVNDPDVQEAIIDGLIAHERGYMQAFLGLVAHVKGHPSATITHDTTPNMARLFAMAAEERARAGTGKGGKQ